MPYGFPAATVVIETLLSARVVDSERSVILGYHDHIEPLYPGADQDGWTGEVICRYKGDLVAVPPRCLRLG